MGSAARDVASVPGRLARALRTPDDTAAPTAEPVPPIDGVSFTTFVTVQAALVRDRVPEDRHDEVAQRHGVPPETWATAQQRWMALVRSDPAVGGAFGAAYAAALNG